MKNKKKFILYLLIFLILLILTVFTIYNNFLKPKPVISPKVQRIIDNNKKSIDVPQATIKPVEKYISKINEFRSKYNNNNIYANLIIKSLNMDVLITRYNNNTFYLDHNIYNNYDELGNPFLDYRNKDVDNNKQVNIYGHNTESEKHYNNLPFVNLEAYTDEYFFKTNKQIVLDTINNRKIYKVIAIKIINDSDEEHMNLTYNSEEEWNTHVNKLFSNTLYKENDSINSHDKLLVLQVCHYNPRGSYLLVIAKEVLNG